VRILRRASQGTSNPSGKAYQLADLHQPLSNNRGGPRELSYTAQLSANERYLLACESLESTKSTFAFNVFERVFKDFGLPRAIRTDNGVPFASPNALFGLSKLAVWWLRLGIQIERIKPGHPQQNGRHERMHLTLKKEATKPASFSFLQQQSRFDDFIEVYNHQRPHAAIGMQYPGEVYAPSPRPFRHPDRRNSHSIIAPSWSPTAGVSASENAKSTSVACSQGKTSGSKRSVTKSGW